MSLSRKDALKDSTDLVRRLDNLVSGLEKRVEALDNKMTETHKARDKVATFLKDHESRVEESSYDSGFEEMEKLNHFKREKERLENLLATTDSPEIEEELLEAEVSEAIIVGESKELGKAA